jgi:hypothetical protein
MKGFVMKLSPDSGDVLWKRTRKNGRAVVYAGVATDRANNAVVAGFTSPTDTSFALIVTVFGGLRGWRRRERIIGSQKAALQVLTHPDGDVIVAGKQDDGTERPYLVRLTDTLSPVWEHRGADGGFLYDVAVWRNGLLAAVGHHATANDYYAGLFRYNTGASVQHLFLGERVSTRPDDYLRGIATDSKGHIVVAGARTVGRTMKVRLSGAVQPSPPSEPHHTDDEGTTSPVHESAFARFVKKLLQILFGT